MHTDAGNFLPSLYLAGLLPALFVVLFTIGLTKSWRKALVPCCYFLALAASFAQPLVPEHHTIIRLLIGLLESTQPALCFIMVMQCLGLRADKRIYVLVMALPLLGGSTLLYLSLMETTACFSSGDYCLNVVSLQMVYQILGACALFLLLMAGLRRFHEADATHKYDIQRQHRYWLMLALVGLNLCLFAADLSLLTHMIGTVQHALIAAVLRISFIYLAITSLYRVLGAPLVSAAQKKPQDRTIPPQLIEHIAALMEEEKLYREMGFSRKIMAQRLEVGEHVISHAINQHFGKNFNEYVNHYRVEEAKERLQQEHTPITVIAFEVGFSSIASFNRVFRQLHGMSPTQHRQQSQQISS